MHQTYHLNWSRHQLTLGAPPLIMGIVNVTPDSFSDGGKFYSVEAAVAHGEKLVREGAHILDIGGESTRPFSDPVSVNEQIQRVVPVIESLSKKVTVPISIDTTNAAVAKAALDAGASIINDISALRMDVAMGKLAAETEVPLILMHMQGTPKDMQVNPEYKDLFGEIQTFFLDAVAKAEAAGVKRSKIIIDPGIGFGKSISHNLAIISRIEKFFTLDLPILVGHSRKAFIRKTVNASSQQNLLPNDPVVEIGTQAIVSSLAMKRVHIIRVHNVANTAATLRIIEAIKNAGTELS